MVTEYLQDLPKKLKDWEKKTGFPETRPNWVHVRETMIVHTRGVLPKKLLETVRPNESEDVKNYRLATYEPITKDGINHAIDAVIRALISSNYKVDYAPETGEYITENKFTLLDEQYFNEPLTLLQLIIEHIGRFMFDDPNSYLVWMPVNPDDRRIAPQLTDQTKVVKIEPLLVDCYNVLEVTEEVLTFQTDEKKELKISENNIRQIAYIYIITKYSIHRLDPYWDEGEKKIKYKVELWYNMGLEEDDNNPINDDLAFPFIPAKVLGGNVCMNEKNQIYFDSFFQSYAAFGNKAIHAMSDNDGVRVRYNFPFSSVKEDECPTCKGIGKYPSKEPEDKGRPVRCKQCKGKGTLGMFTPYGTHIRKKPASGESEAFALAPAVEFYNAPVEILDSSFNVTWKFLDMAIKSVNLLHIEEAQSGVAKEIDREEKTDMLFKICNNIFDLYKFSLDSIQCYLVRFSADRRLEQNVVRNPTTLAVKTQEDLFLEITEMINKNIPQPFIIQTANQLAVKVYNGDLTMQKVIKVLTVWDVLFGVSTGNISFLKAAGSIGNKEMYVHTYGFQTLLSLSQSIKGFEEETIENIITQAETAIAPRIPKEIELMDDTRGEAA